MSSYEQYTELDKPEGYLWLTDEYKKLQQQMECLQEQLEEANEIILKLGKWTYVASDGEPIRISKYLKKWGVK